MVQPLNYLSARDRQLVTRLGDERTPTVTSGSHLKRPREGELSSLDTNVIVMQILDAARESARTGRTVRLSKLSE